MRLSYVIISHNRKETLLKTLGMLPVVTPLALGDWETWVVDNASTDGTADAVAEQFPQVNLIRNPKNQGMFARNHAFSQCAGQYIISIDDDSYPMDQNSVSTALSRMDRDTAVAALVGRVILPSGAAEAPAMPAVLMGGATCFRKMVLDQVGGFGEEFFRQAEEYDLSFRIWAAGYRIERCEQARFRHDKVEGEGRDESLVRRLDMRNNLIIARRFLPAKLARIYMADWRQRYQALANYDGHSMDAWKGMWSARKYCLTHLKMNRPRLNSAAVENIFGFHRQATEVGNWARQHAIWRVVIADLGKNVYATYNACRSNGLQIRCIADDNAAFHGLNYRGLPVLLGREAFIAKGIDGVVISNINPAQVDARVAAFQHHFHGPILRLWSPPRIVMPVAAAAA